jgi:outer membrane immunogenic protein
MKRFLVGIFVTAAIFASGHASAADLPPAPVYTKAPPVYSWTGFYVGGNGGYAWHDPTVTFTGNDDTATNVTCGGSFGGTCVPPTSFNINGGFGGLQAGYNWQFSPKTLVGFETDFDWSRISGMGTSNFLLAGFPSTFSASENINSFGTVRARLGYLPTERLLTYVTAGLAYGKVDRSAVLTTSPLNNAVGTTHAFNCENGPNCFSGSSSGTAVGWTAGGGAEFAVWNNISFKAEYLYVNLGGAKNVDAVAQFGEGFIPSSFTAGYSRTDFHVVRVGLNYKFGN